MSVWEDGIRDIYDADELRQYHTHHLGSVIMAWSPACERSMQG
jgi:hypothetical protein